ncbi:putative reverse transcriptase domain-containing protein [Tanacetum coccineum]
MDPQCSTQIHSSINTITIHPKQPEKSQVNEPDVEQEEGNLGNTNFNPQPQPNQFATIPNPPIQNLSDLKRMMENSDSDTEVTSNSTICKESYANLKKLYDAQREQLSDASIEITAYSQGKGPTWLFDLDYLTDSMNYHPVRSENQANLHAGQQEANQNAGTEDIIDAGDSEKEDESAQDCFVLPIWPSYSSTITPVLTTDDKREGPREEEQVFMDELERLKRQEKEANEEAEALRKKFAQETENLVIQEGAAKPSSTNLVNTVSIPVSTASPHEGLSLSDPTNLKEDDSEIPPLEDIYQNSTDGIFTTSSYDDEGAVADFTNLETVVNVSHIPTSRIHSSHPLALILGDPTSAVQTRSEVNTNSGAHAFVSYVQKQKRINHKDFHHCLFACFLSQHEPKKISEALEDERTVKYPKGIVENVLVGIGKFVFPADFIILDMPEDIKVPLILERPFLPTTHAKIDVFKRKITLRVREEKIIFKCIKPASSLIKRVYMLSLRERMELDLEARLMGETLVLNRSLNPFFETHIELNDLNVPLKLRRDQDDDLIPTIEEGEVVKELRAMNDARMVSKIFGYPSDCNHDKKIPINCAYNLKFSCMIDFVVLEDMDAYRDERMGDVIFGEPFLEKLGLMQEEELNCKMAEQDIPPPTITAMKIPIIEKGEYDIWSMRMRQYICHTDYNLWDFIVNGDLEKEPAPTTRETSAHHAPKTAK